MHVVVVSYGDTLYKILIGNRVKRNATASGYKEDDRLDWDIKLTFQWWYDGGFNLQCRLLRLVRTWDATCYTVTAEKFIKRPTSEIQSELFE